jgi:hypothetical protein
MDDLTDNLLYPKKEGKLTPEALRTYKGCGHYTDEEAINIIETLEQFSKIIFDIVYKKEDG